MPSGSLLPSLAQPFCGSLTALAAMLCVISLGDTTGIGVRGVPRRGGEGSEEGWINMLFAS